MSEATFDTLTYDVDDDGICVITINRPDKLNALNQAVLADLDEAFVQAHEADEVKGVILTGSGDRAFAAGADIRQFTELDAISGHSFAAAGQRVFDSIEQLPKPVVAAVNGFALGGGCELALACHLRVASQNAQFGQPEVALGLIPGYGGTQRLPRLVGHGIAAEMILSGERVTAQRAYEIGLVNRVAPAESLIDTARELLKTITSKAPVAVAMSLKALRASTLPGSAGMEMEAALFGQTCGTEDFREGVDAFLNKREATFQGR